MYKNEKWNELSDVVLEAGVLTIKLPGTNFNHRFSSGKAYVNESGNAGYVALNLSAIEAVESGEEASGMAGMLGEQLREMFAQPEIKQKLAEAIRGRQIFLFASLTNDGRKVLSIPGLNESVTDDRENFDTIVGSYVLGEEMPSAEQTYTFHSQLVNGRSIQSDKMAVVSALRNLVADTQAVYDKALELAKKSRLLF